MLKKLLYVTAISLFTSGCFMAPLALIGPATSGFSTASLIQSGMSSGANMVVKRSTGKTITEHVLQSINEETLSSTYFPKSSNYQRIIYPKINLPR